MDTLADRLAQVLGGFPELRLALLFGSRAGAGKPRVDSDVDLGVLADRRLDAALRIRLVDAVAQETGCAVDLVDLHDAPEPVLGEALKGVRVLGDATAYARLLSRHLVEAADFLPLRDRIITARRARWIA